MLPAARVNGELGRTGTRAAVGWWTAAPRQGDPFGFVVLAGHVRFGHGGYRLFSSDAAGQNRPNRRTAGDSGHSSAYRIVSVVSVPKKALATSSGAFNQR